VAVSDVVIVYDEQQNGACELFIDTYCFFDVTTFLNTCSQ